MFKTVFIVLFTNGRTERDLEVLVLLKLRFFRRASFFKRPKLLYTQILAIPTVSRTDTVRDPGTNAKPENTFTWLDKNCKYMVWAQS
jgi:hypothetical protein